MWCIRSSKNKPPPPKKKKKSNGLNIGLSLQSESKRQYIMRKHSDHPGREKALGAGVRNEGHDDSVQGHEMTHHCWFPRAIYNCKQCFLLPTPSPKFTLSIEQSSSLSLSLAIKLSLSLSLSLYIYIYIYIYIYNVVCYICQN